MKNKTVYTINGANIAYCSTFIDEYGRPVIRTKYTHPYSYDGYVVWRGGKNKEIKSTVWSDRLQQWDYKKYSSLAEKHFAGHGGGISNITPDKIQVFLRDYYDNPKLKLILVMEYCNQSSGYPVWRFDYA